MTKYCVSFHSIEGHHSFEHRSDSMIGRALMIISMSNWYNVTREWQE